MPYRDEFARGDSLWRLVESESVTAFKGVIRYSPTEQTHPLPQRIDPLRGTDHLRRLVAIDGSTVSDLVRNGYPGAEAALLQLAVIVVDLDDLRNLPSVTIPRPSAIRALEDCRTFDQVLPGRNVVRNDVKNDSAQRFFRSQVYDLLNLRRLDDDHETLMETLSEITTARHDTRYRCPVEDCDTFIDVGIGRRHCSCGRDELIFETDRLRIHERFEDHGSSEQAYTAVREVVEHLALVNILRYFERTERWNVFRTTAFIMDGPLAIFGMPAWLKTYVQDEIARLHSKCLAEGGPGILLFGVEKSGQFLDHLKALDWSEQEGPGQRLAASTALAPDLDYIHRHIVLHPPGAKPWGDATYYGRKVLYKNHVGQHSVVMTPIVNPAGVDLSHIGDDAYPRLGEALDLMDELSTYLYEDGFEPLVRAHAHAAIPLRMGTRLLEDLFRED